MPYVVIAVVLVATIAALWLGGRNLPRWDGGRGPARGASDVVGHATIVSLRVGLLLIVVVLAAVAVVGSVAAIKGDADLPTGCYVAAVLVVLLCALVVRTFGLRPHRLTTGAARSR